MGRKNLTKRKKDTAVYIRTTPEFKKKAQIFAIENGISLSKLVIQAVEERINRDG